MEYIYIVYAQSLLHLVELSQICLIVLPAMTRRNVYCDQGLHQQVPESEAATWNSAMTCRIVYRYVCEPSVLHTDLSNCVPS